MNFLFTDLQAEKYIISFEKTIDNNSINVCIKHNNFKFGKYFPIKIDSNKEKYIDWNYAISDWTYRIRSWIHPPNIEVRNFAERILKNLIFT